MKLIDNKGITDPRVNLAIEEYAVRNLPSDDDYLLFYMNEPSVIIGKNQNTPEEINAEYVEARNIHVVRRLSGGGAVYHDLGNLNFSFITNDDGFSFHQFKKFTDPVIQALRELGIDAELTGRNDIQVGDRKISGNARYITRGRMVSHGTLLFDTDLDQVVSALKVNAAKMQSKAIKSIRSRVANISEFLETGMTMEQFKSALLRSIFGGGTAPEYELTGEDWEKIYELSESRYKSWDWNYGYSPKSNFSQSRRFDIGTIEVRLQIEKGRIEQAKIYGDFFGVSDVAEIEKRLIGVPYEKRSVAKVLEKIPLRRYFGEIDFDSFVSLFF